MVLQDIVEEMRTVEQSECLIEGTVKDKISHFVLRLACCQNEELASFFLNSEGALFDWRFSCMSEQELYKLFKSLDPYLDIAGGSKNFNCTKEHHDENIVDILQVFASIKHSCGKWRKAVRYYMDGEISKFFYSKFQNVLNLVQRREVCLTNGIAAVPFCHLRHVTTLLFRRMLQFGLAEASARVQTEDERLIGLMNTVKALFRQHYRRKSMNASRHPTPITNRDVDNMAEYFPLCMSHALRSLRRKHRLGHHTRLTLFLKELGLSVHEALIFWKDEYSKPTCNQGNRCGHDWIPNEGRYTYNIRHLYGLEGSRINYRGHSCKYLQEDFQGHKEEGGCPFRHFDLENLSKVMATEGFHGNSKQIIDLVANGKYSCACQEYMSENIKKQIDSPRIHSSKSNTDQNQTRSEVGHDSDEKSHFNRESADFNYKNYDGTPLYVDNCNDLISKQHDISRDDDEPCKVDNSCNGVDARRNSCEAVGKVKMDYCQERTRKSFNKPIDYYLSYKSFLGSMKGVKPS